MLFHLAGSPTYKIKLCFQNFKYDHGNDEYICDYGKTLVLLYEQHRKSDNGYKSLIRVYECLNCFGCPDRERCVKSEKTRS